MDAEEELQCDIDGQLPSSVTAVLGPDSTIAPFDVSINDGGSARSIPPACWGGVLLDPAPELHGELAELGGPLLSTEANPLVRMLIPRLISSGMRGWRAILSVFSRSSLLQNAQRIFLSACMHNSASPSQLPSLASKLAVKKHPSRTNDASNSNKDPLICRRIMLMTSEAIRRQFRSASACKSRTWRSCTC